ncbi:hypothetical protein NDU88_003333 [Pleurodeles waltl]|uniref:Uncharacterized protein n=1 Tax=Pleurodeles waltl TaxID=8319 RepID=A0AAV7WSJ8_PLEWA|nr:hypothetical protein NDU88_003333 [Pleurodeles waltl]
MSPGGGREKRADQRLTPTLAGAQMWNWTTSCRATEPPHSRNTTSLQCDLRLPEDSVKGRAGKLQYRQRRERCECVSG